MNHVILMGGPKSGQLHDLGHGLRPRKEGDEIGFPVWPPFPMNSQEYEDQWPVVPKWTNVYRIETMPSEGAPGVAVYVGRSP